MDARGRPRGAERKALARSDQADLRHMRGRRGRGWGRGDSDDTASLVGRRVVIEGHGDDELNSNEGVVSEGGDSYGVRLDDETAVREVKKKIISFVELVEESEAAVGALEPFLFRAAAAGKLADAGSSSPKNHRCITTSTRMGTPNADRKRTRCRKGDRSFSQFVFQRSGYEFK